MTEPENPTAPTDTDEGAQPPVAATPEVLAAGGPADESGSSPGSWTAVAAPGKPDGEVDTRSTPPT